MIPEHGYTEEELEYFMRIALSEARAAGEEGEVPVGAVIVLDKRVIASAHNTREREKNALHHAELSAINKACTVLRGWRLHKCDIFVTLEPCIMCAGAILCSRIKNVFFGASDSKAGSFGTILNVNDYPFNHKAGVYGGLLAEEAAACLSDFFKGLRA